MTGLTRLVLGVEPAPSDPIRIDLVDPADALPAALWGVDLTAGSVTDDVMDGEP